MTTLAIVGGGIAGRSLLYALAKEKGLVSRVHFFQSPEFFHPCSLNSTAIVAPRGVSEGHSPLGNLLIEGFQTFKSHVEKDSPTGVLPIIQYTGASEKLEAFKFRYPAGFHDADFDQLKLKKEIYLAQEDGFLINPSLYLSFLLDQAGMALPLTVNEDSVTEIIPGKSIILKTQQNLKFEFDKVIVAGGVANRYFGGPKAKSVQGSYLEFSPPDYGDKAFSLTLNGDNLIYSPGVSLLIGSTTQETTHEMPPTALLAAVYERLSDWLHLPLPPIKEAVIKVGLREKASKRMPYILQEDNIFYVGGFYKNGFSLALNQAQKLLKLL